MVSTAWIRLQLGCAALCLAFTIAIVGCQSNPTATPKSLAPSPFPTGTATPNAATVSVPAPQVAVGDTVVHLSWQAVPGASAYLVYRDGASSPLNPTPVADTHFDDIGLTNGRTYTYTIAAVSQSGQAGPHSAPVPAVPKSQ